MYCTFVILSESGAINIPGGGSLNILEISLIKNQTIFLISIENQYVPFYPR